LVGAGLSVVADGIEAVSEMAMVSVVGAPEGLAAHAVGSKLGTIAAGISGLAATMSNTGLDVSLYNPSADKNAPPSIPEVIENVQKYLEKNHKDLNETFEKAVKDVREGKGPVFIESVTYRWFGHSSSDPGKYRTKEEVDEWKLKDPNLKFRNYLLENNIATEEELVELEQKSKKQIEDAVEFAKNSPEPTLESAFEDIFAN